MQCLNFSLKSRVFLLNAVLWGTTLLGAVLMVWYTYRIQGMVKNIINTDVTISQSSQALGTALANQKGFVSYFLLDRNAQWLEQLARHRRLFDQHLSRLEPLLSDPWEQRALLEIKAEYGRYTQTKDQVIALYKAGQIARGTQIHNQARSHFFNILELCDRFISFHQEKIDAALVASRRQAVHLRYMALAAVVIVSLLSLLVNFIFSRHILGPIRALARKANQEGREGDSPNEVLALTHSVMGLIKNAKLGHEQLKKSQAAMLQSEKLAMVGQLAAGTAHSIRNPLTSVKMRLFSLERRMDFSPSQQEDFKVIATEIQHINRIVENFLEFSRPPKLITRIISPSRVMDSCLHLLSQRLDSHQVSPRLIRDRELPPTRIDPEQLKEVLVNIILNACEAMEKGGEITIRERCEPNSRNQGVAVIQIQDNGPGIPHALQDHIFDPFFTTKDNGTGLGLNIAFNIINQHRGRLDVSSEPGKGSCFIISLPLMESAHG